MANRNRLRVSGMRTRHMAAVVCFALGCVLCLHALAHARAPQLVHVLAAPSLPSAAGARAAVIDAEGDMEFYDNTAATPGLPLVSDGDADDVQQHGSATRAARQRQRAAASKSALELELDLEKPQQELEQEQEQDMYDGADASSSRSAYSAPTKQAGY